MQLIQKYKTCHLSILEYKFVETLKKLIYVTSHYDNHLRDGSLPSPQHDRRGMCSNHYGRPFPE